VAAVAPVAAAVAGEEGCVAAAAGPVAREERDEKLRSCRFGLSIGMLSTA
jgi:hypothetical protein